MTVPDSANISVVIPTRNRPDFLKRTLDSVLHQTYPATEIIIVDDGSDLPVQLTGDGADRTRLSLIRHDRGCGAPAARNTGLSRATGEFIAFLDDDDHWEPEKLEAQLTLMQTAPSTTAGVFCFSRQWSPLDPDWQLESRTPGNKLAFNDFLEKTWFGTSVPLLKRQDVLSVGGFDESLVSVQDRDLWLRLARRGSFIGLEKVLVHRAIHGDQITTQLALKIKGREQFMAKYRAELIARPKILLEHLWKLGLMYCAAGEYEEGRERLRQGLKIDPKHSGLLEDLQHSVQEPPAHADTLRNGRFNRVGDLVLYY